MLVLDQTETDGNVGGPEHDQIAEKLYYNSTGLCKPYLYDSAMGSYVESLRLCLSGKSA